MRTRPEVVHVVIILWLSGLNAIHAQEMAVLDSGKEVRSLAFSPDNKWLACGGESWVTVWDVAKAVRRAESAQTARDVHALAYGPGGKTLVAVSGSLDVEIAVLNPGTGKLLASHKVFVLTADKVTIAPKLQAIIILREDGMMAAWDVNGKKLMEVTEFLVIRGKPKEKLRLESLKTRAVIYSPNGRRLLLGDECGEVSIVDLATNKRFVLAEEHKKRVCALAYCPRDKTFASGSSAGEIVIWNSATRKTLVKPVGHEGTLAALRYSLDGKHLISAANTGKKPAKGELKIWEVSSGDLLATRAVKDGEQVHTIEISPDGKVLAVAHGESVTLFEMAKLLK